MTLARYNPMREIDDFFERFNWPSGSGENGLQAMTRSDWMPSVDISESDDEFLIKVEVPEVKKDDIKIQVNNGVLTIGGERKHEKKDRKQHRVERYYGSFTRSFSLPDNVEEDAIEAKSKDGMLYLHLKKAEKTKPRSLEIKVS